ncbi:MAG TPA: hypothetical protein VN976_03045 [Verrucomicrobiae bacterium]|nr:hypothetical protein [Verrucomicrobiae bacterium]
MQTEILDEISPGLADESEAGDRKFRTFSSSSVQEYESLRERLAMLIAEDSLQDYQKTSCYQLTLASYGKYKPRIDALRTMRG